MFVGCLQEGLDDVVAADVPGQQRGFANLDRLGLGGSFEAVLDFIQFALLFCSFFTVLGVVLVLVGR